MSVQEVLEREFATIADLIREHAKERAHSTALVDEKQTLDYAALDALIEQGRWLRDAAPIHQALRILTDLGADADAALAREILAAGH